MYDGEIYKTRNLRNLSMNQLYEDPDDLKRAQDSIDRSLREFGKDLWVPTREQYLEKKQREAEEAKLKAEGDTLPERTVVNVSDKSSKKTTTTRTARKTTKKRASSKVKSSSSSSSNSNAAKSVRRRKR